VFVRVETDVETPYVQQPVGYRVKMYYRQPMQRALLSEPRAEGASIERDGDDRRGAELVDGEPYQVIERRFLIVPQRSGTLTIEGPRLEAIMPAAGAADRDPFGDLDAWFGGGGFPGLTGPASPGRRVIERVPDLALEVRPQPPASTSPWLPAKSLELADEWESPSPRFEVGEPVTRILAIMAVGLTSAQLPSLQIETPEGVQMYAGEERTEDLQGSAGPIALRSIEVTLVPTRAGPVTLPEIRLPWWDTVADMARLAIVPSRTIEVVGLQADAEMADEDALTPPTRDVPAAEPGASGWLPDWVRTHLALDRWGVPLVVVLLLSAVGALWLRRRLARRGSSRRAARRMARQRLQQACLADDARTARAALLAWAQAAWSADPPQGLGAVARRFAERAVTDALTDLERALYAGPETAWDGGAAWRVLEPALSAVERATQAEPSTPRADVLPALYPPRV
jgi:hypothetical protein